MEPTDFTAVIDLWPSVADLAGDIGEKTDTVRKWRTRNAIPSDKWARVVEASKKRRYKITASLLVEIARSDPSEGAAA